MPTVAIVRPGATDYDEQHRVAGCLDLPLTEEGVVLVRGLVDDLRDLGLRKVYFGPHRQARQTAEILAEGLGCSAKELSKLANFNQGLWQGLTVEEIRRKHAKAFKRWCEHPERVCPPSGETADEVIRRTDDALAKALHGKHAFAVVAGEPLATLLVCRLTGEPVCFSRLYGGDSGDSPPFQIIECSGG